MTEKGVDTEKGGKKTWKTQEEDILISEWGKYEYLSNRKADDYKNNDKKEMAREAISKVIREETGT